MSTDAIIWYGLCWAEEDQPAKLTDLDSQPVSGRVEEPLYSWLAQLDLIHPVDAYEIVYHCSGEALMFGLAVKESKVTAYRGHPKFLDADWDFASGYKALYRVDLRRIADALGVESKAGWWLASYWA